MTLMQNWQVFWEMHDEEDLPAFSSLADDLKRQPLKCQPDQRRTGHPSVNKTHLSRRSAHGQHEYDLSVLRPDFLSCPRLLTIFLADMALLAGGCAWTRRAVMSVALGDWVSTSHSVLITGPTGAGKSWLACALAHYACRRGHSALYQRVPRFAEELRIRHASIQTT